MAKAFKAKEIAEDNKRKETLKPLNPYQDFTGIALTVQASKEKGFNNFRICTLFVVGGEIVHIEKSQEFAAFETIARTEMLVHSSLWNLSSRHEHGLYQSLGGDKRDELVKRLAKTDPELLLKIAPALNISVEGES